VARLRSVIKDQRCVYCQQQLTSVYVTRFIGDYTQQVSAEAFDQLKVGLMDAFLQRNASPSEQQSVLHVILKLQLLSFGGRLLQAEAAAGELHYLDAAQAYFDDVGHYDDIRSMCSFTHPRVWQDGQGKTFNSLRVLKAHLQQQHKLHFCDICLEGRKVRTKIFNSEQYC
jgi:E3 ubiquitin-protein ligase ZNF598